MFYCLKECTLAEFEYQVDELLFRMNSLSGTSNLPEKQDEFLSDSGQSQTLHEDRVSSLVGPEVGIHAIVFSC